MSSIKNIPLACGAKIAQPQDLQSTTHGCNDNVFLDNLP